MAKTAVVNRRRRRKNAAAPAAAPRRRRYYGAAKRRRNPSAPRKRSSGSRRRRNPGSAFNYSAPARTKNPDMFDVDRVMAIAPAAGLGVWAIRWALKMAGELELKEVTDPKTGVVVKVPVPGIKHAIAGVVAANLGSGMIGQFFNDSRKGEYAEIAGLGFLTDLFARTRLFDDSEWVRNNLLLMGVDDAQAPQLMSGLQETSSLGDAQYFQDEAGNVFMLEAGGGDMSGLQSSSTLGAAPSPSIATGGRPMSSFGY